MNVDDLDTPHTADMETVAEDASVSEGGNPNQAPEDASETNVEAPSADSEQPAAAADRLRAQREALKAQRDKRAHDRELADLRARAQSYEEMKRELDELKLQVADPIKHLKELGLNPREMSKRLVEQYQKEIFSEPDEPEETDPIKKELNELKAWRQQQEAEAQKQKDELAKTQQERARFQQYSAAKQIIDKNLDRYPLLADLGAEGADAFVNAYNHWYNDPSNKYYRDTMTHEDELIIADAVEEAMFEQQAQRYLSWSKIDKFRKLSTSEQSSEVEGSKKTPATKSAMNGDQQTNPPEKPTDMTPEEKEQDFLKAIKELESKLAS